MVSVSGETGDHCYGSFQSQHPPVFEEGGIENKISPPIYVLS